jgi:hypothetical protein
LIDRLANLSFPLADLRRSTDDFCFTVLESAVADARRREPFDDLARRPDCAAADLLRNTTAEVAADLIMNPF